MTESAETPQACSHHWTLSSPVGESTSGICKHCGAVRLFNDAYRAPGRSVGKPRAAVAPRPATPPA